MSMTRRGAVLALLGAALALNPWLPLVSRAAAAGLTLTPTIASVTSGKSVTFQAAGGTAPYAWTLSTNASGGSITSKGVYTAGPKAGTDVVAVTDASGATASATVTVAASLSSPDMSRPPTQ